MKSKNYSLVINVKGSPDQAFQGINSVDKWWTENVDGSTIKKGDSFKVSFGTTWKVFKIVEFIPGKKVIWLVTDCYMPWNKYKTEWTGTKIDFEISEKKSETQIKFTHVGLVPEFDCYDVCENTWGEYLQLSLKNLIDTGKGSPDRKKKK